MSEELPENDLSEWLSTYGLVTAERILERYQIRLQREELISAIKSPNTFYHRVMRVPLKNVLNGIIMQQAHDYQVYAQKLFIDYLLSGETAKTEDSPGSFTRDDLEKERQSLIKMSEDFSDVEFAHRQLIAESQKSLIKLANEWSAVLTKAAKRIKTALQSQQISISEAITVQAVNVLLILQDFTKKTLGDLEGNSWVRVESIINQRLSKESRQVFLEEIAKLHEFIANTDTSLTTFTDKVSAMSASLREFRSRFYNLILKTNELVKLLPEYRIDEAQTQENREALYFDKAIGEED